MDIDNSEHEKIDARPLRPTTRDIPAVSSETMVKYLGVKLKSDLRWNIEEEIAKISAKLNRLLEYDLLDPD